MFGRIQPKCTRLPSNRRVSIRRQSVPSSIHMLHEHSEPRDPLGLCSGMSADFLTNDLASEFGRGYGLPHATGLL